MQSIGASISVSNVPLMILAISERSTPEKRLITSSTNSNAEFVRHFKISTRAGAKTGYDDEAPEKN